MLKSPVCRASLVAQRTAGASLPCRYGSTQMFFWPTHNNARLCPIQMSVKQPTKNPASRTRFTSFPPKSEHEGAQSPPKPQAVRLDAEIPTNLLHHDSFTPLI